MKQADYQSQRSALLEQAKKLRARAEERDADIEALDRLWKNVWSVEEQRTRNAESPATSEEGPTLSQVVREFAKGRSRPFTTNDVERFVKENHPALVPEDAASYSKPLRRAVEKGLARVVEEGVGTKRSVYEWIKSGQK